MSNRDHEAETACQRAKRDIERELADDHYRRTMGLKLKALAADMRVEVAASPGVIHLALHHCYFCGQEVGLDAQSTRNPSLFLCADCRAKWQRKP
jgi:hypothetical protein